MGKLFSPIGIVMFTAAALIDLAGLVILCFGLDDFGLLDMTGLIFIGAFMFITRGRITVTRGAKKTMVKILKRLGLAFLIEIIPLLGGISPSWIIATYFHLKD